MKSSLISRTGLKLAKTPSHREQVARRRAVVVGGMLGLALASGLVGALTSKPDPKAGAETGPFSYFPYQ